jgi:hypothetical protein
VAVYEHLVDDPRCQLADSVRADDVLVVAVDSTVDQAGQLQVVGKILSVCLGVSIPVAVDDGFQTWAIALAPDAVNRRD